MYTISQIPPTQPARIRESWLRVKRELEILRAISADSFLQSLLSKTEKAAALLFRSLMAKRGAMREEWRKIAEMDAERFLDCISELHEYLENEKQRLEPLFSRAFFVLNQCIDPHRLFQELRKAGALREDTWALLNLFGPKELCTHRVQQRIQLLARLLFELREVDTVDAERR